MSGLDDVGTVLPAQAGRCRLRLMAKGEHVVDRNAPTASLEELKAQVAAYRVER